MIPAWITVLFLSLGCIEILAEYWQMAPVIYATKPATMMLLIATYWRLCSTHRWAYLIGAGLYFGMLGDILLMVPDKPFVAGLGAFLIGHLFYIAGYAQGSVPHYPRSGLALPLAAGLVLWLVLFCGWLWPHVPAHLQVPVIAYIVAIGIMALVAVARRTFPDSYLWTSVGAILFVASDSALSYRLFVEHFEADRVVIMGTYFAAQYCIARGMLAHSQIR